MGSFGATRSPPYSTNRRTRRTTAVIHTTVKVKNAAKVVTTAATRLSHESSIDCRSGSKNLGRANSRLVHDLIPSSSLRSQLHLATTSEVTTGWLWLSLASTLPIA